MLLKSSNMAFVFNPIDDLKKHFYTNNEWLQEEFNEPTVLPVPDNAPLEVPRIILTSKNEYSQLLIFKNSVTFQTEFSEDFQTDWSQCINYLQKKLEVIMKFVEKITGEDYYYFGLVVDGVYKDNMSEGNKYISKKLLKDISIATVPHDIQLRYTFKHGEDFFINISVHNLRTFNHDINNMEAGKMKEEYETGNLIGINIDVNDRLGFNTKSDYKTDSEKIRKIMEIMKENVESKIDRFIEKGVYTNES